MTSTFFDDFIGKLFGILKAVPRQTVTRGISVSRSSSSLSDISKALYDQLEGILTTAQFSCLDSEEFQKNFGEDVQALNGVFEREHIKHQNEEKTKKAFKNYVPFHPELQTSQNDSKNDSQNDSIPSSESSLPLYSALLHSPSKITIKNEKVGKERRKSNPIPRPIPRPPEKTAGAGTGDEKWTCSSCTLINPKELRKCEACNTLRPSSSRKSKTTTKAGKATAKDTTTTTTTTTTTATTSERTPLKELQNNNVDVVGQDRTTKISLRDIVNSESQDLEDTFCVYDLEKIAAEEEACAKILENMANHVNEARTVGAQNSLILPSTWLIDDDGSTLISPTGRRFLNYMDNKIGIMSEIKIKYRDDYAKMVAHAHDNIGNGNGFRLATAAEKVLGASHRTTDPDFVVNAYPEDWKVIVHVKNGSRLLALTPQGEVFDTKKKAVVKLVEMQKQQAMERGEWQPKVKRKRKSQLGIPNPFSPVKRAKRVVKKTQFSQFVDTDTQMIEDDGMYFDALQEDTHVQEREEEEQGRRALEEKWPESDDEEGKGRKKKTTNEEAEEEVVEIVIDSGDDTYVEEEEEEEKEKEARKNTKFSVGAIVSVAPSKLGRKMETYVGTIFKKEKDGNFAIKPVNEWQGRSPNSKPMMKTYRGVREERLSLYEAKQGEKPIVEFKTKKKKKKGKEKDKEKEKEKEKEKDDATILEGFESPGVGTRELNPDRTLDEGAYEGHANDNEEGGDIDALHKQLRIFERACAEKDAVISERDKTIGKKDEIIAGKDEFILQLMRAGGG